MEGYYTIYRCRSNIHAVLVWAHECRYSAHTWPYLAARKVEGVSIECLTP